MKNTSQAIFFLLRLSLGLLFILSAVLKLISIDQFEVYIFSFKILSLNTSFIFARICIGGELLLGLGLASNLYNRFVNFVTYTVLSIFTVFLIYTLIIGRNESCQCFGALIDINPLQSLIKNLVLYLWTWLASKAHSYQWRPYWYHWIILITLCFSIPFLISKPDCWGYHNDREIPYNFEILNNTLISDSRFAERKIRDGNKIIAFVSPICPYCKMCIDKLRTIKEKFNLSESSIVYVIPEPPLDGAISLHSIEIDYNPIILERELFSLITYGQRPIVIFVNEGTPIQSIHYRAIDEKEITNFLE